MKFLSRLACLARVAAVVVSPLAVACGHVVEADTGSSQNDLSGSLSAGTYLIDGSHLGITYISRLTISAGQKYEADYMAASADFSAVASGSYSVQQGGDRPTLVLSNDLGADLSFGFDKLPSGNVLQMYGDDGQVAFTLTRDSSAQPTPTNGKTIACTGNTISAKLTLDASHHGTLVITRGAQADRNDPPDATVTMGPDEFAESDASIYLEGHHGEQDYYINMPKLDWSRGHGNVDLNLRWAQDGQEWDEGTTCAFAP